MNDRPMCLGAMVCVLTQNMPIWNEASFSSFVMEKPIVRKRRLTKAGDSVGIQADYGTRAEKIG